MNALRTLQRRFDTKSRTILDWTRDFSRSRDLALFQGKFADVVGFVYKDDRSKAGEFWITRLTSQCCRVHAWPVGMLVQSSQAGELEAGIWLHVTGKLVLAEFMGERIPAISADETEIVPEPEQPMLFDDRTHLHN